MLNPSLENFYTSDESKYFQFHKPKFAKGELLTMQSVQVENCQQVRVSKLYITNCGAQKNAYNCNDGSAGPGTKRSNRVYINTFPTSPAPDKCM